MNTKDLVPAARRVADTLYSIKLALMILTLIAGAMYGLVSLFATDDFGASQVDWAGVVIGTALLLNAVWTYALFGFGEYVIRLQIAQVEHNLETVAYRKELDEMTGLGDFVKDRKADFDQHVATAPGLEHGHFQGRAGNGGSGTIVGDGGTVIGGRGGSAT